MAVLVIKRKSAPKGDRVRLMAGWGKPTGRVLSVTGNPYGGFKIVAVFDDADIEATAIRLRETFPQHPEFEAEFRKNVGQEVE